MYHVLLYRILPRFPAKSAARFRVVSKQWNTLLSSSKFKKVPVQSTEKLLLFPNKESCMFTTLDCNKPQFPLPESRQLPFELTSIDQIVILCSIHGLVCVGIRDDDDDDDADADDGRYNHFILWNPTTGDYKRLSDQGSHSKCFDIQKTAFGLYFTSSEDDYKLVCLTCDEGAYIYSLKSNSWRGVEASREFLHPSPGWSMKPWTPSNSINGKVYFLQNRPGNFFSEQPLSVISFDTLTERLKEIATPSFGGKHTSCPSFTVVGGSLQISVISQQPSIEVWRLTADEQWLKLVTYFPERWLPRFPRCARPLHVFSNGSWLLHDAGEGYFYILDLHNRTSDLSFFYDGCIPPRGNYIETWVSPNGFTE